MKVDIAKGSGDEGKIESGERSRGDRKGVVLGVPVRRETKFQIILCKIMSTRKKVGRISALVVEHIVNRSLRRGLQLTETFPSMGEARSNRENKEASRGTRKQISSLGVRK